MMQGIPSVTTEIILAAIAAITTGGEVLTGAVAQLWKWVDKRIVDCEDDRRVLHGKIEGLHGQLFDFSETVGRIEKHLEYIDERREGDHPPRRQGK
jgi:hypothetical protein